MENETIATLSGILAIIGWLTAKYGGYFIKVQKLFKLIRDCAELKADPKFQLAVQELRKLFKKHFGQDGDVLHAWFEKKTKYSKIG